MGGGDGSLGGVALLDWGLAGGPRGGDWDWRRDAARTRRRGRLRYRGEGVRRGVARTRGRGRLRYGTGAVVEDFAFLELHADALAAAEFFGAVEFDAVGMKLGGVVEAGSEVVGEAGFVGTVDLLDVQDEFIHVERVVVVLAEFELPGADVVRVVEDVLELVSPRACL